ncbi:hypothetical protein CQW23_13385 [Capsicum baccatum]|uniref:DNA/RNA-binding protein Kin17 WH-like domain-containing protein n=1 Tax=Capsicum baccatum TaxID=33114 RepID=A0A2G2WVC2_CAPBA|nr:hypothetical protein CQW23_13385 [Capsicum baccatum]
MGKDDILTPTMTNRILATGMEKLRWYCDTCQMESRDENGFKCYCMSESYQREMEISDEDSDCIDSDCSEEFERLFLKYMRRNYRFSHVSAAVVYEEYSADDRHHVFISSTQWATLTEFVKYLGETGKCKVEQTLKGLFITYIDRDSEALFKEKMKNKRIRADLADQVKLEMRFKKQRECAEQFTGAGNLFDTSHMFELHRYLFEKPETDQNIKLKSGSTSKSVVKQRAGRSRSMLVEKRRKGNKDSEGAGKNDEWGGCSVMDQLTTETEQEMDRINRKDNWIIVGIIVKVVSKDWANTSYYKQKGIVRKVIDKYVGEIEMLESRDIVRVDQDDLETVLPQLGGLVRIINGAYRANARLLAVDRKNSTAKVQIKRGIYDGKILKAIDYKDIAMIAF